MCFRVFVFLCFRKYLNTYPNENTKTPKHENTQRCPCCKPQKPCKSFTTLPKVSIRDVSLPGINQTKVLPSCVNVFSAPPSRAGLEFFCQKNSRPRRHKEEGEAKRIPLILYIRNHNPHTKHNNPQRNPNGQLSPERFKGILVACKQP